MSTGYYDCQICNPRDEIVTFNRLVLVFVVVLFLACLLILCCLVFWGLDVVLGLICLLIVFRSTSKLVYGSYHLFTE